MPDARTRAVLDRRRSGAAGPHGNGRREVIDPADEIAEALDERIRARPEHLHSDFTR